MTVSSFKVLLVGEASVGKSSLIRRLLLEEFDEQYQATVGVDLSAAVINVDEDKQVILTLVDLGGQKDFTDLRTYYYKDAHYAVLVYDISEIETYDSLQSWYDGMQMALQRHEKDALPGKLVGNKADLDAVREVSYEKAKEYALSLGWEYVETSAKTGKNVHSTFTNIGKELVKN
jgi:small GTP-binding protein